MKRFVSTALLLSTACVFAQNVVLTDIHSATIHYADVSTGKNPGTLKLKYSIEFLNDCIAKFERVNPIAVKGMTISANSTNRIPLLLVFQKETMPGIESCMTNAMPTIRRFEADIEDLVPGARYDIQISGMPELGSASAFREEAAGS